MSFAAGFASTFVPLVNDAIDSRIERNEKQADIAWKTFLENKTLREKKQAEAARRLQQAEYVRKTAGLPRDATTTIYEALDVGGYKPDELIDGLSTGAYSLDQLSGESGASVSPASVGKGFEVLSGTRAEYKPTPGMLNISLDFNASPSGDARGTEVIIPDDASPEVRAAAERFNQRVAEFAQKNGIANYPVRGVRTRSENGRGVPHTVHAEPFFNTDLDMQQAIKDNPEEFAAIYMDAFGSLPNGRMIAPHGVGKDRGAASDIFGDETSFGQFITQTAANLSDINGTSVPTQSSSTPTDNQMGDLFKGNGAAEEIFNERVAAAGFDPNNVSFDSSYEDPMLNQEPGYRLSVAGKSEEWRDISTVREGNWRSIAAKADEAGEVDYAERVRALGKQFDEGGYSLSDQTYVITYRDDNGQTRRVTAPVDENTGRFIDLSTGNAIERGRLVGDAVPSENVSGFLKEYARISGRVEPFQERRGALLDTMRSANSLENLVRQNDDILTSIGGGGARLVNSLRQEYDALNSLVTSGATDQEISAEIDRIAQENTGFLDEVGEQAQLATLFNAEVLRFAFNYAKTGLGQEGVGLSNKDFDNALKIVSAGSSYDTFSKNLRSRVSEGIAAVEDNRLELGQDPAVRAVLEMPNAERWTSDLLNSSTEQFVQSRGLGEVYQWSQTEPEAVEQAQNGTQTEPDQPDMEAFNRVLNDPKRLGTLEAFETRLSAAENYSPEAKRTLRKQFMERLGLTEGQYDKLLKRIGDK